MPYELKENTGKDGTVYKNLIIKNAQHDESFEFTPKYERPLLTHGKYGERHVSQGTWHSPNGDVECSFSCMKRSTNYGKSVADVMSELGIQRIKFTPVMKTNPAGNKYFVWQVAPVNGAQAPPSPSAEKIVEQLLDETQTKIVEQLVADSGGVQLPKEWLEKRLRDNGMEDQFVIDKIYAAYVTKW